MSRFLLAIILIFFQGLVTAQEIVIPFEEEGWVYVDVKVNDNDETLSFFFDTGASSSVISKTAAERIGLKSNYQQNVSGATGNETYDIATNQTLHVGTLDLSRIPLVMVNLTHLAERSGRPIDGIVGYDIISRFITQLDFDAQSIKLYNTIESIKDLDDYSKTDVVSIAPIPIVPLDITLKNGETLKGNFYFDSGANSTVLFTSSFVKQKKLKEQIGETYSRKNSGLTSTLTENLVGNVQDVTFGNYTFKDVPVILSNATQGVLASNNISGILGAKIINRFQVILDYKNRNVYLKPNKKYVEPIEQNYSGISLIKKNDVLHVDYVVANSMASKLGIEKGDQLLKVNNSGTNSMKAIKDILQKEGEVVALKIKKKDNSISEVKLKLQRIIK